MNIKPGFDINLGANMPEGARQILAAAETLFGERGYSAVTIGAIAEKAGVSKANIFYHFKSKQELYNIVLEKIREQADRNLRDFETKSGTFEERLSDFAVAQLRMIIEAESSTKLLWRSLLEEEDEFGKVIAEKVHGDNFARFIGSLREAQAQGVIRSELDPAIVATTLLGANSFFFLARCFLRHCPDFPLADKPEEYSREMVKTLLMGILTEKNR